MTVFLCLQDGFTAIDVAVQQGHEKVVAALLHHDSRVMLLLKKNSYCQLHVC